MLEKFCVLLIAGVIGIGLYTYYYKMTAMERAVTVLEKIEKIIEANNETRD